MNLQAGCRDRYIRIFFSIQIILWVTKRSVPKLCQVENTAQNQLWTFSIDRICPLNIYVLMCIGGIIESVIK